MLSGPVIRSYLGDAVELHSKGLLILGLMCLYKLYHVKVAHAGRRRRAAGASGGAVAQSRRHAAAHLRTGAMAAATLVRGAVARARLATPASPPVHKPGARCLRPPDGPVINESHEYLTMSSGCIPLTCAGRL